MKNLGYFIVINAAVALSACMQNEVPGSFATTYPSGQLRLDANQIEPQSRTEYVYFNGSGSSLTRETTTTLNVFRDKGLDAVWINGPAGDAQMNDRLLVITRLFRGMGVTSDRIYTNTDSTLAKNTYRVDIAYTTVRSPDCPNWSSAAATNFNNVMYSQMGCANSTNIGQMIKHPQDLEMGRGNIRPGAERTTSAIETYNAPAAASASNSTPVSSGASGNSIGSAAAAVSGTTP